jgi:hypothetical protein
MRDPRIFFVLLLVAGLSSTFFLFKYFRFDQEDRFLFIRSIQSVNTLRQEIRELRKDVRDLRHNISGVLPAVEREKHIPKVHVQATIKSRDDVVYWYLIQ